MHTAESNREFAEKVGLYIEFEDMRMADDDDQEYVHDILVEMSLPIEVD